MVSPEHLRDRRRHLLRRRQTRIVQALWRSLLLAAMSGGVIWLVSRPDWVISDPQQVAIEGNQFLSDASVRAMLPIAYPQPLLEIEPQALTDAIAAQAPIAKVAVVRHLFPPSLTIEITEHKPVAIAIPGPPNPKQKSQPDPVGFVDAEGFWMPQSDYVELETAPEVPTLTVVGLSDETRSHWPRIYQALSHSTLEIFEIDLRSPNNIILKTELGTVHLGSYVDPIFTQQLQTLAQMRQLPAHIPSDRLDYIDLRNPAAPSVQLKP